MLCKAILSVVPMLKKSICLSCATSFGPDQWLKTDRCCVCAVPCVPQQVEAQVVCETGAVSVSWEPSKGASSYTTIAQGNGGYASTCNSSHATCLFNDLLCGLNYSITVRASDETCSSAGSAAMLLNTGRIKVS